MTNVTTILDSLDAKSVEFESTTLNNVERNRYNFNFEELTNDLVDEVVVTYNLREV